MRENYRDSISKNTDLLVIKDKDTSGSKVNKAKELNIKIITKKVWKLNIILKVIISNKKILKY